MFRMKLSVSVLSIAVAVGRLQAAEDLGPAAQWVPRDAAITLEVANPQPLLELAIGPKTVQVVTSHPLWQLATLTPQYKQFRQGIDYLESRLDTDWRSGLEKLVGGGITLAATPSGGSLLMVESRDAKMLGRLHEIVRQFVQTQAGKKDESARVHSSQHQGVAIWSFGPNEFHAVVGSRLIVSNRREMLVAALGLRSAGGKGSLAESAGYRQAQAALGSKAPVRMFVDLVALRQRTPLGKALGRDENPMGALLFGGLADVLRRSPWLALTLDVQGQRLTLEATAEGTALSAEGVLAFAWPRERDQGAMPLLSVPRQLASLSFYRDLHGFYAAKDKLFPERTSGLIFFENMMGIFFSGRDLTEEVLAETLPEIRFVVAAQQYDPALGTPQVQIPAFAAIFRLKNPAKFGEVAEEAWQKAVGLVNITRGQKGQPGLVIDRAEHRGQKYSVAYFSAAGIEDKKQVPSYYNFRPALALAGDRLIVSSTDGLARDLMDVLRKETAARVTPVAGAHTLASVDLTGVGNILKANRDHLVRQNMLEKGHSKAQAELETDLFLKILSYLGQARLTMDTQQNRPHAKLELELNLP